MARLPAPYTPGQQNYEPYPVTPPVGGGGIPPGLSDFFTYGLRAPGGYDLFQRWKASQPVTSPAGSAAAAPAAAANVDRDLLAQMMHMGEWGRNNQNSLQGSSGSLFYGGGGGAGSAGMSGRMGANREGGYTTSSGRFGGLYSNPGGTRSSARFGGGGLY